MRPTFLLRLGAACRRWERCACFLYLWAQLGRGVPSRRWLSQLISFPYTSLALSHPQGGRGRFHAAPQPSEAGPR